MSTGRADVRIPFRSLLGRVALALGFPPPTYNCSCAQLQSGCVVIRSNVLSVVYAFLGRAFADLEASLEDAAEQGLRELMCIYKVSIVDINWADRAYLERQKKLFDLQRKRVCQFKKRQPINLPCPDDWRDNNEENVVVVVNFVEILACVVQKLGLKVSPLECMQLNDTVYVSYSGVHGGDKLFGVEWVVGDECSSAGNAQQNVAKKQ